MQDEAKRFENYVALELNHWVNYFNALTVDRYELYYVRTHSGKESDFLITRNEEPYVLFEVKMSESKIDAHHLKQAQELGNIPFVQILYQKNILKASQSSWVISADWFF